ncbi:Uncharacterized protein TCAP_00696 [Tolypocladium capitatum]|uniref:Uncharacterized protein n=1 Tax=Tolypocladium capitatum TaxID=45235 RepID=A0A2K3QPC7_9HYPO|nr:Uncharacterized protein TCAP_00696 [Tolypocladium capitatum]
MANVNTSCPISEVPRERVLTQIHTNATYAIVASQTAPDQWMARCCDPKPVHIVENCWEWCEVNGTDKNKIFSDFWACLAAHKRNDTHSDSLLVNKSGTATELFVTNREWDEARRM